MQPLLRNGRKMRAVLRIRRQRGVEHRLVQPVAVDVRDGLDRRCPLPAHNHSNLAEKVALAEPAQLAPVVRHHRHHASRHKVHRLTVVALGKDERVRVVGLLLQLPDKLVEKARVVNARKNRNLGHRLQQISLDGKRAACRQRLLRQILQPGQRCLQLRRQRAVCWICLDRHRQVRQIV